jgi:hypothetical protein
MSSRSTPTGPKIPYGAKIAAYLKQSHVVDPMSQEAFDEAYRTKIGDAGARHSITLIWSELTHPGELHLWSGSIKSIHAHNLDVTWTHQDDEIVMIPDEEMFTPASHYIWRIAIKTDQTLGYYITQSYPGGVANTRQIKFDAADTDLSFLRIPGVESFGHGNAFDNDDDSMAQLHGTMASVPDVLAGIRRELTFLTGQITDAQTNAAQDFAPKYEVERITGELAEMNANIEEFIQAVGDKLNELAAHDGAAMTQGMADLNADVTTHANLIRGLQQRSDQQQRTIDSLVQTVKDLHAEIRVLNDRAGRANAAPNPSAVAKFAQMFQAKVGVSNTDAPSPSRRQAQPSFNVDFKDCATWPILVDSHSGLQLATFLDRKFGPQALAPGGAVFEELANKRDEQMRLGVEIKKEAHEKTLNSAKQAVTFHYNRLRRAIDARAKHFKLSVARDEADDEDAAERHKGTPADATFYTAVLGAYTALQVVVQCRKAGLAAEGERALLERYDRDIRTGEMTEVEHAVSLQFQEQLTAANNARAAREAGLYRDQQRERDKVRGANARPTVSNQPAGATQQQPKSSSNFAKGGERQ